MNKFFYLRDRSNLQTKKDGTPTRGNPVAVVITNVDRKSDTISYNLAIAHKKDHFVKAFGRKIAKARLEKLPFVLKGVPESNHKIVLRVMEDILTDDSLPTRVRRIVKKLVADYVANEAVASLVGDTIPAPPPVK